MSLRRWRWPSLLGLLVVIALVLAFADATLIGHVPHPFAGTEGPGRRPPPLSGPERFPGFGARFLSPRQSPIGGLFSFWWFISLGFGLVVFAVLVIVAVPGRVRAAIDTLEAGGGAPVALLAGVASLLLLGAFSLVVRLSVVLLPVVGVIWAAGAVAILFGVACLALYMSARLRRHLGPVHPVLAAITGLLVMTDLSLLPYVGWVLLALVGLTGLGVSVMTRFGSARGWSLEELDW